MNRTDFANLVAVENEVPKDIANKWVAAIFEALGMALLDEDEVSLYGFGKFEKKHRAAKKGRLPTGEAIDIPERNKIKFTPSVYLDDAVKDGLDSVAFSDRMSKIRALKRGECVPGYKMVGDKLVGDN